MEIDLTDSVAIVTGAGRGIGETVAETFAGAGADVVVTARTTAEIETVAERIEADHGVDALPVTADVRVVGDLDRLVEAAVEELGTPDLLLNNAGTNPNSPALAQPVEEVDALADTNLRGPYLLSQRFARAFRESDRESGRIVNVSSITAQVAVNGMTFYGGTKSGLYGITRGLAAELADDGITVNSVTPGIVEVERTRRLVEEHGDEIYDFDRLPLGRLGDPGDVADCCLFLCSEHAAYVTGEDVRVDGGAGITAGLYR